MIADLSIKSGGPSPFLGKLQLGIGFGENVFGEKEEFGEVSLRYPSADGEQSVDF